MDQTLMLLGSLTASCFALVRFALNQTRALTTQFVDSLEGQLRRQEASQDQLRRSLDSLAATLADQSRILRRLDERHRSDQEEPCP